MHRLRKIIGRSHPIEDVVFCGVWTCVVLARATHLRTAHQTGENWILLIESLVCGLFLWSALLVHGCRTFHSLGTYMWIIQRPYDSLISIARLAYWHLAAHTPSLRFIQNLWPSILVLTFSIVFVISMVTSLQQLIVFSVTTLPQIYIICNFDTLFLTLNCSGCFC
jgi:hypothetical protein